MSDKTFWIQRRVTDPDNGYPVSEALFTSKEGYVNYLEGQLQLREQELKTALEWIYGTDKEIGLLQTTDGYYEWTLDPRYAELARTYYMVKAVT